MLGARRPPGFPKAANPAPGRPGRFVPGSGMSPADLTYTGDFTRGLQCYSPPVLSAPEGCSGDAGSSRSTTVIPTPGQPNALGPVSNVESGLPEPHHMATTAGSATGFGRSIHTRPSHIKNVLEGTPSIEANLATNDIVIRDDETCTCCTGTFLERPKYLVHPVAGAPLPEAVTSILDLGLKVVNILNQRPALDNSAATRTEKDYWEYVAQESDWLSRDFHNEKRWKVAVASRLVGQARLINQERPLFLCSELGKELSAKTADSGDAVGVVAEAVGAQESAALISTHVIRFWIGVAASVTPSLVPAALADAAIKIGDCSFGERQANHPDTMYSVPPAKRRRRLPGGLAAHCRSFMEDQVRIHFERSSKEDLLPENAIKASAEDGPNLKPAIESKKFEKGQVCEENVPGPVRSVTSPGQQAHQPGLVVRYDQSQYLDMDALELQSFYPLAATNFGSYLQHRSVSVLEAEYRSGKRQNCVCKPVDQMKSSDLQHLEELCPQCGPQNRASGTVVESAALDFQSFPITNFQVLNLSSHKESRSDGNDVVVSAGGHVVESLVAAAGSDVVAKWLAVGPAPNSTHDWDHPFSESDAYRDFLEVANSSYLPLTEQFSVPVLVNGFTSESNACQRSDLPTEVKSLGTRSSLGGDSWGSGETCSPGILRRRQDGYVEAMLARANNPAVSSQETEGIHGIVITGPEIARDKALVDLVKQDQLSEESTERVLAVDFVSRHADLLAAYAALMREVAVVAEKHDAPVKQVILAQHKRELETWGTRGVQLFSTIANLPVTALTRSSRKLVRDGALRSERPRSGHRNKQGDDSLSGRIRRTNLYPVSGAFDVKTVLHDSSDCNPIRRPIFVSAKDSWTSFEDVHLSHLVRTWRAPQTTGPIFWGSVSRERYWRVNWDFIAETLSDNLGPFHRGRSGENCLKRWRALTSEPMKRSGAASAPSNGGPSSPVHSTSLLQPLINFFDAGGPPPSASISTGAPPIAQSRYPYPLGGMSTVLSTSFRRAFAVAEGLKSYIFRVDLPVPLPKRGLDQRCDNASDESQKGLVNRSRLLSNQMTDVDSDNNGFDSNHEGLALKVNTNLKASRLFSQKTGLDHPYTDTWCDDPTKLFQEEWSSLPTSAIAQLLGFSSPTVQESDSILMCSVFSPPPETSLLIAPCNDDGMTARHSIDSHRIVTLTDIPGLVQKLAFAVKNPPSKGLPWFDRNGAPLKLDRDRSRKIICSNTWTHVQRRGHRRRIPEVLYGPNEPWFEQSGSFKVSRNRRRFNPSVPLPSITYLRSPKPGLPHDASPFLATPRGKLAATPANLSPSSLELGGGAQPGDEASDPKSSSLQEKQFSPFLSPTRSPRLSPRPLLRSNQSSGSSYPLDRSSTPVSTIRERFVCRATSSYDLNEVVKALLDPYGYAKRKCTKWGQEIAQQNRLFSDPYSVNTQLPSDNIDSDGAVAIFAAPDDTFEVYGPNPSTLVLQWQKEILILAVQQNVFSLLLMLEMRRLLTWLHQYDTTLVQSKLREVNARASQFILSDAYLRRNLTSVFHCEVLGEEDAAVLLRTHRISLSRDLLPPHSSQLDLISSSGRPTYPFNAITEKGTATLPPLFVDDPEALTQIAELRVPHPNQVFYTSSGTSGSIMDTGPDTVTAHATATPNITDLRLRFLRYYVSGAAAVACPPREPMQTLSNKEMSVLSVVRAEGAIARMFSLFGVLADLEFSSEQLIIRPDEFLASVQQRRKRLGGRAPWIGRITASGPFKRGDSTEVAAARVYPRLTEASWKSFLWDPNGIDKLLRALIARSKPAATQVPEKALISAVDPSKTASVSNVCGPPQAQGNWRPPLAPTRSHLVAVPGTGPPTPFLGFQQGPRPPGVPSGPVRPMMYPAQNHSLRPPEQWRALRAPATAVQRLVGAAHQPWLNVRPPTTGFASPWDYETYQAHQAQQVQQAQHGQQQHANQQPHLPAMLSSGATPRPLLHHHLQQQQQQQQQIQQQQQQQQHQYNAQMQVALQHQAAYASYQQAQQAQAQQIQAQSAGVPGKTQSHGSPVPPPGLPQANVLNLQPAQHQQSMYVAPTRMNSGQGTRYVMHQMNQLGQQVNGQTTPQQQQPQHLNVQAQHLQRAQMRPRQLAQLRQQHQNAPGPLLPPATGNSGLLGNLLLSPQNRSIEQLQQAHGNMTPLVQGPQQSSPSGPSMNHILAAERMSMAGRPDMRTPNAVSTRETWDSGAPGVPPQHQTSHHTGPQHNVGSPSFNSPPIQGRETQESK